MPRVKRTIWTPNPADYSKLFAEQNPWHATGQVPEEWARSVRRPLARHLPPRLTTNNPRRFQVILGPRRVGKSTTMYQVVASLLASGMDPRRLWWLRLDHPLLMNQPLGALVDQVVAASAATREAPAFLFLDELTYASAWDQWLKTFYDESRPVQVVGTSSSTAALRSRRRESGVGRWEEQHLSPYLFGEYLELIGHAPELPVRPTLAATLAAAIDARPATKDLARVRRLFLLTGGFPELATAPGDGDEQSILLRSQRILRTDAVERAVYKDIPQAFGIDNPMMLERVLYALAGQMTGVLSARELCQSLGGLSQPTFDRYLSYLIEAFLVFTLQNYSRSEGNVQRRGRKVYFIDGAVRNAALQRGTAPLDDPVEMGYLLENLAAGHLHALGQQEQVRVFYWREGKHEVDLVYDHPDEPVAFEIGSSPGHSQGGLRRIVERFPRFMGRTYLVTPGATLEAPSPDGDRPGQIPMDLFLLATSARAAAALEQRLAP
jgi:predicted AAA+ superfamily ATPase